MKGITVIPDLPASALTKRITWSHHKADYMVPSHLCSMSD